MDAYLVPVSSPSVGYCVYYMELNYSVIQQTSSSAQQ